MLNIHHRSCFCHISSLYCIIIFIINIDIRQILESIYKRIRCNIFVKGGKSCFLVICSKQWRCDSFKKVCILNLQLIIKMIDLCLIMYVLYSQFRYVSSVSIRTITINRDIIQLCNASTSAWPSTGPSTNLFNSQLCKHHCKQSIVMIIIILSLSFLGFAFVSTLIFCACWVLDSYTYASA